jgi:hypothetical protein
MQRRPISQKGNEKRGKNGGKATNPKKRETGDGKIGAIKLVSSILGRSLCCFHH